MNKKILHNAKIYTMNPKMPTCTGIAIQNRHIIGIGKDEEILSEFGKDAEVEDMKNQLILPGLHDAHLHLEYYALGLQKVDCETSSLRTCLERVAERVRETPKGEWVLGHGWNQNEWNDCNTDDGFPVAADLDAIAPEHPVFLTAKSLHAGWLNSAGMRRLGITPNTPDPENGQFLRDTFGKPTGITLELAMEWVVNNLPTPTIEQLTQALNDAQKQLWRMGITSVIDYDQRSCFVALQHLRHQHKLKLRVTKGIPLELLDHAVALGLQSGFGDEHLRIGSLKLFADGALGPHTAAMFEPYEDDPQNRGILFMDADSLFEVGKKAVSNGISVAVHAIGDRAIHETLNAFEHLRRYESEQGLRALRHSIEHVQILHPQDVERLPKLSITASMQPIHALSDMSAADHYWGKRAALSHAWQSQVRHGVVLAFGSDAPVESPNPFWGLYAAITRRRFDGSPPGGWYPSQRLTIDEALRAYTTSAAYAAGAEHRVGQLSNDFLADLIVIEEDPFLEVEKLKTILPRAVMIGGEWVSLN
jgi:predicted amidohydrolase YtcJ